MTSSRRKLPSLNALRAFEVSGRRLSFRAAAEELGVTQGAVAQQVRALEDHLGLALFQRLPRGLALTTVGTTYLTDVTHAFDTLGDATRRVMARPDTVTLSMAPSFAARMLIPRLAELSAALPGVELRTVATETLADFDRDQVDIAVRLIHPPFPSKLEARLLFHQELVAVASPHLIKGLSLPLTEEQLQALPLLHDAHDHWPMFLPKLSQNDVKLSGAAFSQTTLALDAALAGQGVALACWAFVARDLEAGRLVQVTDEVMIKEPGYFLVRQRSPQPLASQEAVWNWCLDRLSHSTDQPGRLLSP